MNTTFNQKLSSLWKQNKGSILFLFLVFILFFLFTPDTTTPGKFDRRCWITWSNYMLSNGLENVYNLGVNYLPLYHYVLYAYAKLAGSTENIIYHINSLKYFTLFFELIGVFFILLLARKKYINNYMVWLTSMAIIFNPAFFYDSVLYGQVDGIYSTFIFVSVFFGIVKKPTLSSIAFLVALNLKLQAITYVPLVFLVNLESVLKDISFSKILSILMPSVVLQVLILLPFAVNGNLGGIWKVITESEGRYPFVSMGAFNFWYFFVENPKAVYDKMGFLGRSYHRYGQILYIVMIMLAIFPYLKWNYEVLIKKKVLPAFPVEKILLMGVLMSIIFFYFNTEMHSRYVHASIIFAGAYALYSKRYLIFSVLSLAYFLNIESSAKILKGDIIEYSYFFFNPVFVASLFAFALILCFMGVYSKTAKGSLPSMQQIYDV